MLAPAATMDLQLLEKTLADRGEPGFRARQVWAWTARGVAGYEQMTDLPAALRDALAVELPFSSLELRDQASSRDGTVKALFATADGRALEAVLMRFATPSGHTRSPLGLRLLAVGLPAHLPLLRDRDDEVRAQPQRVGDHRAGAALPSHRSDRPLRVHGHGRADDEPRERARRVRAPAGPRRHPSAHDDLDGRLDPRIERLAEQPLPLRLALSLHAADDALRSELMPVNERYPLADVIEACRAFYARKRRRVFIEYVMLAGVNDRYEQALALARLLNGSGAGAQPIFKVNLIPYNPTDTGDGAPFSGASRESIAAFRAALESRGVPVTVRLTRGRDIAAACGQLAAQASSN